ncbi:MAG: type 4a pilus biogenesis protein PilO [Candidatus Cloacimonetes bacterium]|nr:type 4a pilus biogenesis protein PilO [Candidatus Cloacimonadota bacterium]
MKNRYLLLLLIIVIVTVAYLYFSSKMINYKISRIAKYDKTIKTEQEKLNSAKVLNEQLQEVSKVIINSMTLKKQINVDEVNSFVKKLADLADRYQIAVHSLTPKFVDTGGRFLIEQEYTMQLECTYVQIGNFLSDLESYDNLMNVKTFVVRPMKSDNLAVDGLETHYKITLQLSTYKIVKEV